MFKMNHHTKEALRVRLLSFLSGFVLAVIGAAGLYVGLKISGVL
jgi:hypothetical protein